VIRVRAVSLNPVDWHLMRGEPSVLRMMSGKNPKRRIPGHDVAGEVEAVGASVTLFRPGDEVFGACSGGLAEYAPSVEKRLARKPSALTWEQAASIPVAGCTALQAVRDHGRLRAGQRVLINGAAGGVGTFAVQIAKALGAEVTGVCSTLKVEWPKSCAS
jgi:NADPH:quinone reductase-like Zn-dependent oxidoreductase